KWGKPLSSLLGAYDAQMKLGLAAIGGKDSMSGTYQNINVPPTLISFACANGIIDTIISPEFKQAGNFIYHFNAKSDEKGLPKYDQLIEIFDFIHANISSKKIVSVKTIKDGGVAVAMAKMSFGNFLGAEINFDNELLLSKNIGGFLIESTEKLDTDLLQLIGEVKIKSTLKINDLEFDVKKLLEVNISTFESVFPTIEKEKIIVSFDDQLQGIDQKSINIITHKIGTPQVFAPVFPGTNCEYETQNAFRKEGAKVESLPFVNLSHKSMEESIENWVKKIKQSQILVFSGGFSAGDEPDGSAKFMVNVLKNSMMKDAVHEFLEKDGLLLGICNGFQALVKSGLLPFGEIKNLDENAPTLAHNAIGRHISQMVNVKVVNDKSPWLKGMKEKIYTIPVSHGEGRFMASANVIEQLYKNGQIATQYVDFEGVIAHGMPYNPNQSLFGIEGVTSESGKIYGRMGHTERYSEGLFKNIPDANYHNIFKNGIDYFK
ncbi:MAG: phosphoribosylformylglycinamidine synthase subunit PurQ, partial [Chryseobacterium sp.]|nr:phosphoribosylformylglycinamidine synthase subunit PurQ [Chryseobacterium sp.]